MDSILSALPALLAAFGPAGTVLLLLVILMAYFYRRDFRVERRAQQEAHERRDRREERIIEALEGNATNSEKVAGAINLLSDIVRRSEHR